MHDSQGIEIGHKIDLKKMAYFKVNASMTISCSWKTTLCFFHFSKTLEKKPLCKNKIFLVSVEEIINSVDCLNACRNAYNFIKTKLKSKQEHHKPEMP